MLPADILERARGAQTSIVFADGDDERARDAAGRFVSDALGSAILLSSRGDVSERDVEATQPSPRGVEIVVPADDPRRAGVAAHLVESLAEKGLSRDEAGRLASDPLYFGGMMVRSGEAGGMVAGATRTTADVIRAALRTVGPAEPGARVSSFFLMTPPAGPPLTFADCGVMVRPSAEELAEIALAAAANHRALTGAAPRVAFVSFSTHGSAEHPELERVRAAAAHAQRDAAARGFHESDFDGELQVDAALDPEVAARKAPGSSVAGRANVLVFPDLATGNVAYKLVQRLGGAGAYGPILQGLARPVNDLSRGASADDIFAVAVVTALQTGRLGS